MDTITITVTGKSLGSKKKLFADFSIPGSPELVGDGGLKLKDLIDATVRHQVTAFEKRQADRKFLKVLTQKQIEDGVEKGKIFSGGAEGEPQKVDPDNAVAVALEAFSDGIYLVSIDDTQIQSLEQQIFLQPDSRITFIRLTLLAGG